MIDNYRTELERQIAQKQYNLNEIKKEIALIESDLNEVIFCFRNRLKAKNYAVHQDALHDDMKEMQLRVKTLSDSLKTFKKWFNFWKKQGWCDHD